MTVKARYLITAENKTDSAFRSVKKNVDGLKTAFAGLAAAASIGTFARIIKGSLEASDAIEKMARRFGTTTEALSQLKHAAELSGTSWEQVAKAMRQTQRSASEAERGVKTYSDAFDALGIDIKRFIELKPEDQLQVMADALVGVTNVSERTALAMQVMGRSGSDMIPLLEGGSAGLREMMAEADRLGLTLDNVSAKQAAATIDAFTRMKNAFNGVTQQLAIGLGPTLAAIAEWFAEHLPSAIGVAGSIMDKFRAILVTTVSYWYKLVELANTAASVLPDALGGAKFQAAADQARAIYLDLTDLANIYWEGVEEGGKGARRFGVALGDAASVAGVYDPAMRQMAKATDEVAESTKKAAKEIEVYKYGVQGLNKSQRAAEDESMAALEQFGGASAARFLAMQEQAEESTTIMSEFAVGAARSMEGAFSNFFFDAMQGNFKGLEQSFLDTINRMVADLLASQLLQFLLGDFGTTGQLGGVVGDFAGKLLGFQNGGAFTVAGAGGTDSQLVAFRATPGERVEVRKPGQVGGGLVVNMTVNASDAASFRRSQNQILTQLQTGLANARRIQ